MASPERRARLAAIARAHRRWEDRHLADGDGPTVDPARATAGSDYGLHHLTVDATPAQLAELAELVDEELRRAGLGASTSVVE